MLKWLRSQNSPPAIGLDLGSWSARIVTTRDAPICCSNAVLWDLSTNQAVSLGDQAQALEGRHPQHCTLLRPILEGLLADFDAAEQLVRFLLKNHKGKTSALASAPVMAGEIELQFLAEMLQTAGCSSVCLLPSAACLAIAAGHPPPQYPAVAVLELGHQLAQATVFSRGTAVHQLQISGAAQKLRQHLRNYLLQRHWLSVGSTQLSQLLSQISAIPGQEKWLEVRGKDVQSGLPRRLTLAAWELDRSVELTLKPIVRMMTQLLEETPPDLLQILLTQGLFVGGGFSNLNDLPQFLSQHLSLPIHIVDQAPLAVSQGLQTLLKDEENLKALVSTQILAARL